MMTKPIFNLPQVSVIVPVYNGAACIGACLAHLKRQNYPGELLEIIVVDDGSTDQTLDIVRSFDVKWIAAANQGPAGARNQGIQAASGQIIVLTDADCLADEDLVIRHVLAHLYFEITDPRVRVIGGGIAGYNQNFWSVCDDFCSWYKNHPALPGRYVPFHPTANMSFSRELAGEVKFDGDLRFAEDFAFCVAVRRKGYKIYFESRAKVAHINRISYGGYMKHAKDWAGSQYQLLEKGFITPIYTRPRLLLYQLAVQIVIIMAEIAYYAYKLKRFNFLICWPFILLNKLYLHYFTMKHHRAFYKSHPKVRECVNQIS